MIYLTGGVKYSFDYQKLVTNYNDFVSMSDHEFLLNLPEALHTALFICYVKGYGREVIFGDEGIIHGLTHLLASDIPSKYDLKVARKQFKKVLKLVR